MKRAFQKEEVVNWVNSESEFRILAGDSLRLDTKLLGFTVIGVFWYLNERTFVF